MKNVATLTGLIMLCESETADSEAVMSLVESDSNKDLDDSYPIPDYSITYNDVDDDEGPEYYSKSLDRAMTMYKYAIKIVGKDKVESSEKDACSTAGCGGSDIGDMDADDHAEVAEYHSMYVDLADVKPTDQKLCLVLSRIHSQMSYALRGIAGYRAQVEWSNKQAEKQKDASAQPQVASMDATGKELYEHTPGIRRALRALGKRRTLNKDRIKRGENPIIGGRQVSPKKFKQVTGVSVSHVRNEK